MMARLEFISARRREHPVAVLCRLAGVVVRRFYDWLARAGRRLQRERDELELVARIRAVFDLHKGRYGSPRVHATLWLGGVSISRKRVAKLMRKHGIRAFGKRKKAPVTTDSGHGGAISPNLLDRNFKAAGPNLVWLSDITYIPTQEGWLYLAGVKDMFTRELVGWSMSTRLKSEICEDALKMAVARRNPPKGVLHHSDRGSQYASRDYRKILGNHKFIQSMSRKGNCIDNAPMESFFGSLKNELVHQTVFRTVAEAKRALFEYVEVYYNRVRLHSGIGYRTPEQAWKEWSEMAK